MNGDTEYCKRPRTIYFMRPVSMPGPVKIGCSVIPADRLSAFLTWSPFPLEIIFELPGSYNTEQQIHQCLASSHSHREWFHPTADVLGLVRDLLAGLPLREALGRLSAFNPKARIPRKKIENTPSRSMCLSRKTKLGWALKKANVGRSWPDSLRAPNDVSDILDRWIGNYHFKIKPIHPTDAEIARVDEVIADVITYCRPYREAA